MQRHTTTPQLKRLALQLRTIGDDTRLCILCVLIAEQRACVSDIAQAVQMTVATVSHHLQVLTKEKVVTRTREGKYIYYALSKETFVTDLKRHICKYTK